VFQVQNVAQNNTRELRQMSVSTLASRLSTPTEAELLDRARALAPVLRDRAAACEENRSVLPQTVADFEAAGFYRILQPAAHGGYEMHPMALYRVAMELAKGCPSSAWCLCLVGVHNWEMALLDPQAARDVWGADDSARISSSYGPFGRVERVDGGFMVSGRWPWSSGCDHCQWVFLGGVAPSDGRARTPLPDMRTFLVPRSDYQIIDNWHVAGLSGTGSKDIVVEDAFVPEHRTHRFADAYMLQNPGQAVNDGTIFRLPFGCIFSFCIAVPAIGAARGALDAYRAYMQKKVAAYDGSKVADDPFAQRRLSEAAAEIDAAESEVRFTWETICARAEAGETIPLDLRARARWSAANIVLRGVRAVDLLFEASGGRALFLDNPIQRYFRDVHAMRAHALNNPDKASQIFGYAELHPGAAPPDFFL
jgi:3-hydroxy-9,10-secoandrosta-1,3,5(10)-triene-9,17-dione monooxygenase